MAQIIENIIVFEVLGTKYGIADAAGQLLWVSTALSACNASSLTLNHAELEHDRSQTVLPPKTHIRTTHIPHHVGTAHVKVTYKTTSLDHTLQLAEGQCWHNLFQQCAIVDSYPIPARPSRQPGLEIPLEMMAMLACAERVTPFGNDLIVKGFSTLLFATGYRDKCMTWHLICNDDDSRVSFADDRIPTRSRDSALSLQLNDAFQVRHIVGWTGKIRSNTGMVTLSSIHVLICHR